MIKYKPFVFIVLDFTLSNTKHLRILNLIRNSKLVVFGLSRFKVTAAAAVASKMVNNKELTVEQIYQKKSQLEHILLRPDTYIGSVEMLQQEMWIWDFNTEKMVKKEISFVPGLYKIFDEILGMRQSFFFNLQLKKLRAKIYQYLPVDF